MMRTLKRYFSVLILLILTLFTVSSCKNFLDVGPPKTEVGTALLFDSDNTAAGAMLSLYGSMMSSSNIVNSSFLLSQSADELISYSTPPALNYYTNSLDPASNNDFWTFDYTYIYRANAVLDGLDASKNLTLPVKRQLRGEALFMRAFLHFYLVNLFGEVPYIATTNYKHNTTAAREPVAQVYQKIIADLKEAKGLLTDGFPGATNLPGVERVRPNKGAARTMLARTYLYMQDWNNASLEADSVISNTTNYSLVADLNGVFLKNSKETIWQLQPSSPQYTNGYEGGKFILTQAPSSAQPTVLSDQLWNAFEAGDKRKTNWVGTFTTTTGTTPGTWHFSYKYKVNALSLATTEYSMVLRLAEVYLIRAEARIQNNDIQGGIDDLNVLRARARQTSTTVPNPFLPNLSVTLLKADALVQVAHERQVELFTEWGHRWLDLKRTNKADVVLGHLKGANWQTTDQLFPIPKVQIDLGPSFEGRQNPGYN